MNLLQGLILRAGRALNAFRGSPGAADVFASTVLRRDEHDSSQRPRQYDAAELVCYFMKHVAVAAGKNATAVASTPLGLYRRGRGSKAGKSAWRSKALTTRDIARKRMWAGSVACKALDMDDGVEEITDPAHPILALIRNPNPRDSQYDLLERACLDLDLTGDHYHYKAFDSKGAVAELWPFDAQFTRPIPDREKFIKGYIYGRGRENEKTYDPSTIIAYHMGNPKGDPYHGMGALETCIRSARLSLGYDEFSLNVLNNGMQPGMVISPKGDANAPSPAQAKALEVEINSRRGPVNAGKNWVIAFPADVTKLALNEKEVAFLSSDEAVMKTTARAFGVPVEMMTMESAALATAAVAKGWHQEYAVKPRCQRMEDRFNLDLLRHALTDDEIARGESLFLMFEEVVTEDADALTVRVVSQWGADLLKFNEARTALGYDADPGRDGYKSEIVVAVDPFGGGGQGGSGAAGANGANGRGDAANGGKSAHLPRPDDSGTVDASARGVRARSGTGEGDCGCAGRKDLELSDGCVTALTNALILTGATPEAAKVEAEKRCRAGHDNSGGMSPASAFGPGGAPPSVGSASMTDRLWSGKCGCGCCDKVRAKDDRGGRGAALTERQLEAALREWFDGIGGKLSGIAPGTTIDLLKDHPSVISFQSAVERLLGTVYLNGWNVGAAETGARGGDAARIAGLTGKPQEYLHSYAGRLTQSVLGTLSGRVTDQLAAGVGLGENVGQLRQRVSDVMRAASTSGAETIARTETARAFGEARVDAWRDSGVVAGKRLDLSVNPCEVCLAVAAKGVMPLDTPLFALGETILGLLNNYADVQGAAIHPNCRCSVVAVFQE